MLGSLFFSVSSVEAGVHDIYHGKKLGELQSRWLKGILI